MHWRRKWQPTPVFLPGESQGREAWWAAVYGVAQSRTQLKRLSSSSSSRLFYLWDFSGKNTGAGCHFLLQGIFPTQGLNPYLLNWQADSLPLSHLGSPFPPYTMPQITSQAEWPPSVIKRDSSGWQVCVLMILLLPLLLSHFSRVRLCATPETAAHQAPLPLGFSRQKHWSGLPFPSPMHESEK